MGIAEKSTFFAQNFQFNRQNAKQKSVFYGEKSTKMQKKTWSYCGSGESAI
jgi:3-mercaptopyruvate sulfurtransferase SseA